MQYGFIIPESPKENLYKEQNEEELYKNIFSIKFNNIENLDEINLDNIYYLNSYSPKNPKIKNEINQSIQDPNNILLIDDYETVFKKLEANQKGIDQCNANINENYERDDFNKPFFIKNPVNESKCFHMENENDELFIKINAPKKDKNKEIKDNEVNKESKEFKENKEIKEIKEIKENKENKEIKENKENKEIFLTKTKISKKEKPVKETKNIIQKTNIIRKKRGPYKKKGAKIQKIKANTEDKSFPFTSGKGLLNYINPTIHLNSVNSVNSIQSNEDYAISNENEKSEMDKNKMSDMDLDDKKCIFKERKKEEETGLLNEQINCINDICLLFTTKKYFIASNGRKKKVKKKRKFKPDDIRKKIKSRFHKLIKNIINENLKKAGSQELFDFMPQSFIGNVSKKINSKALDLTYKEILTYDFNKDISSEYLSGKVDYAKYYRNQKVLKYLEDNPEIAKRAGFDIIQNMKYKDLLKIYFSSAQFEKSIYKLKTENECSEYIIEYIYRAKTYISFYSN